MFLLCFISAAWLRYAQNQYPHSCLIHFRHTRTKCVYLSVRRFVCYKYINVRARARSLARSLVRPFRVYRRQARHFTRVAVFPVLLLLLLLPLFRVRSKYASCVCLYWSSLIVGCQTVHRLACIWQKLNVSVAMTAVAILILRMSAHRRRRRHSSQAVRSTKRQKKEQKKKLFALVVISIYECATIVCSLTEKWVWLYEMVFVGSCRV